MRLGLIWQVGIEHMKILPFQLKGFDHEMHICCISIGAPVPWHLFRMRAFYPAPCSTSPAVLLLPIEVIKRTPLSTFCVQI